MGSGLFGLGGSDSSTAADYAGASDQAAQLYKSQGAQMGQTNVGKGATVKTGGIDVSKAKVAKGGTLSITVGDTKPLEDLSKEFSLAVQDINAENSAALSKVSTASGEQLGQALAGLGAQLKDAFSQLSTLSESKQTEGESGRNQVMLWVVLGVLALMGFIFFWRR